MNKNEQRAYAIGIIARELNIDMDSESPEVFVELNSVLEDVLLDEPKTEANKKLKKKIEEEMENKESEYNSSFNFHKDLNQNKINPATVFILETLGKNAEKIVNGEDKDIENEIIGEIIKKLNEINFPIGYVNNPFNTILALVGKLNSTMKGQVEHREEEIKALSVGVRHPKYKTLSPHLASIGVLDDTIKKLREKFNFTEEDYR